jgi:hypothetical protein
MHENQRLIIGLGSGRSGTVSLKTLLNMQHNHIITHERRPLLPWAVDKGALEQKLFEILTEQSVMNQINGPTVLGDIAFYYLPYVELIMDLHPNTVFICMKRDKKATVDSYMKWTKGRNHWMLHNGIIWRLDPEWDVCYPSYNMFGDNPKIVKRFAVERYWLEYYLEAEGLQAKYPDNFMIVDIEDLNSTEKLPSLLYRIGIHWDDQFIKTKIHENKGKQ